MRRLGRGAQVYVQNFAEQRYVGAIRRFISSIIEISASYAIVLITREKLWSERINHCFLFFFLVLSSQHKMRSFVKLFSFLSSLFFFFFYYSFNLIIDRSIYSLSFVITPGPIFIFFAVRRRSNSCCVKCYLFSNNIR